MKIVKIHQEMSADLVLYNGKIVTMDENDTIVSAVAIKKETIIKVGTLEEVEPLIGENTRIIDLEGKTVLPGFVDSHVHFHDGAITLRYLIDLKEAKSIEDILKEVQKGVERSKKGEWVLAKRSPFISSRDWDSEGKPRFSGGYPTRWDLDSVAPDNPVVLYGNGNHVALANSEALRIAEIDKNTPDILGGKIGKDPETGEPTGILIQKAIGRLDMRRPNSILAPLYTTPRYREGAKKASEELLSFGITTIHAIPQNPLEVRAQIEAARDDDFPLRVHMLIRGWWEGVPVQAIIRLDHFLEIGFITGFGNNRLKIGGIKLSIDGPGGIVRIPRDELEKVVIRSHEVGLRCCIHAGRTYALEWALDAIEKALKKNPQDDHRHRIEHAGNLNCTQEHLDRIKRLGVIPSFQPPFLYLRDNVEVSNNIIPFPARSMLDKGIRILANSDWPGVPANPFIGIYAMVTRKNHLGDIISPEEAVSLKEAIKAYTVDAAYAEFDENIKGSIEEGKLADIIILSEDPFSIDPEKLLDIKVLKTIIGGRIVYEK